MTRIDLLLAPLALSAGLAGADGAARAMPAKDAPPSAAGKAASAPLKALPLKRGFYVAKNTPCRQASTATLLLVTREGINGAREACTFRRIEKTGATTYRVAASCSGQTATVIYEIPDATSFTSTFAGSRQHDARYCAQSSLPDPWRDNDIGDL